ncbi:Uncharacterized membrane protein YsdA, DUF1294 family [Ruminococcus sp. YE71]|uniref:DUF1294 domain-containing protein n=1 Tax=unclassified Ruminococcus TaxID=2608920 RepID=UPI000888C7D6|nr:MULTISPECIES: DUF1294 domain-containing protein [unclassified Ruminococcus]SDA29363.1 Uncharacterized membrane protein YsdA, DUF1294 family [Ruminococcus sp. YE78]SFW48127.1 Uncharacterized membrane protein YsdA, DUF1294 family [Ruminococcus sp. YE71]
MERTEAGIIGQVMSNTEAMRKLLAFFIAMSLLSSLATFVIFGIDKKIAKANGSTAGPHLYRIPEKLLLWLAFLYGSPGALLGMNFFHHKTRKLRFRIAVPLFFTGWLAAGAFLAYAAYFRT